MIGRTLDRYTIDAKLGEGGMGVVYKALDTQLSRPVALKILPHEYVADPARKLRFVQEAKAASALNHPGIVTVHDIGSDAGIDFIVMEYVDGTTLDQMIPVKGLPPAQALAPCRGDRGCCCRRTPGRHHPSRSQAVERHRLGQRPPQGPRLRPGEAAET